MGINNNVVSSLEELHASLINCKLCNLRAGCRQIVFGKGSATASIVFIGEGPGAQEDEQGIPFVGAAGKLLDKIIAAAELPEEKVYIANVVKCRPPGNRTPLPNEVTACKPYLLKQIEIIKPKVVVTLGAAATQALIDPQAKITKERGIWREIAGIMYMPTFHPAALLRDPAKKRPVWEDIQKVRDYLRE